MMTSFRLTFLLTVLLAPALARAQQPASTPAPAAQPPSVAQKATAPSPTERRTIVAMRLTSGESIVLDGRLDDTIWRRTQPAGDFVQQDPDNGRPATLQPVQPRKLRNLRNAGEQRKLWAADPEREPRLPAADAAAGAPDHVLSGGC